MVTCMATWRERTRNTFFMHINISSSTLIQLPLLEPTLALATTIMTSLTPAIASLAPSRVASLSDLDRVIPELTPDETEPLLEATQGPAGYGTHQGSTQHHLLLIIRLFGP